MHDRQLPDEQKNKLLERIPLGRLGKPDDIDNLLKSIEDQKKAKSGDASAVSVLGELDRRLATGPLRHDAPVPPRLVRYRV